MYKRRIFYTFILLFGLCTVVSAETKDDVAKWPNEIRIGWGDQLFESLMWHNPTTIVTTMPSDWKQTYHEDYRHNQHLWLEYQWRFNNWFSFGGMVDLSEVNWRDVTRNGAGIEIARSTPKYFYNAVIMPTTRFTYFHHPYVNLHSGLGLGMDINGGTERNSYNQQTVTGIALYLNLLGISVNYDRWFMAVDLGGLTALQGKNTIFMAASRIVSVSIGARFNFHKPKKSLPIETLAPQIDESFEIINNHEN